MLPLHGPVSLALRARLGERPTRATMVCRQFAVFDTHFISLYLCRGLGVPRADAEMHGQILGYLPPAPRDRR
jgi:hypothetical protein